MPCRAKWYRNAIGEYGSTTTAEKTLLLGVSHGPARELERLPSAFPRFLSNRSLPSLIAAGKSQFQSHQSEDRKPAQATERGFRDWRRGPARRHCARL